MPEPHLEDKVWEEKPIESETEKVIFVHDKIEGKRCQVCDKELKPEKIFWYTTKGIMSATNPEKTEIAKDYQTKIHILIYGMCSKKCKNAMIRILRKKREETEAGLKKEFGDKITAVSFLKVRNLNKKLECEKMTPNNQNNNEISVNVKKVSTLRVMSPLECGFNSISHLKSQRV